MGNRVKLTTAVPRAPNPIANLPMILIRTNRNYFADGFVARDDGEWVSPGAGLNNGIRVTDARSKDLGKNLETETSMAEMLQKTQKGNILRPSLAFQA